MKYFLHIIILIFSLVYSSHAVEEINLYTSRHYESDKELYKIFEQRYGIKVNYISSKGKVLIERIKSEGEGSPADVLIVVDAGNLWRVEQLGMFQEINSPLIKEALPEYLIGENNMWIALTKRARVIFYNPATTSKKDLHSLDYEDLSELKWKNKIAIRSSNNIYNQSLVASLIHRNGYDSTKIWMKKFIENFARKPQGNDRAQIIAVSKGEAHIAIANSYYIGLMLSGNQGVDQQKAAAKINIHFPNQKNSGTHMNISGAGILRNSPNYKNAVKFLEFLLSPEAQKHIIYNTFEYSVLENVEPHPLIRKFGISFKEDIKSIKKLGKNNARAVRMMDQLKWH
jgi:iron(III) transport system substrate-binding protein